MLTDYRNIPYGIVEFVDWCIMRVVIKAENDWHDVGRPQAAMVRNHFSCIIYVQIVPRIARPAHGTRLLPNSPVPSVTTTTRRHNMEPATVRIYSILHTVGLYKQIKFCSLCSVSIGSH